MESYCNKNVSDGRNNRNVSDRSNCNAMNCMCNHSMGKHESQMGNCNQMVQNQNRMMQQCRREDKIEQYARRQEQIEHCRKEERMEVQRDREDRNCKKNVKVECVCQESSEKECHMCDGNNCHRHDDMEKLGCGFPLVMAYVPWQQWGDMYEAEHGLKQGTIFKDLNYIFCGERC